MPSGTPLAQTIADACEAAGLKAKTAENYLAVKVSSEVRSYLVWLPDERWDFYVWGDSFQYKVTGAFAPAEVAIAIKGTL